MHPNGSGTHDIYLMCDDVNNLVAEMKRHGISCDPVRDQGWGLLTPLTLPSGAKLGVYQPRHERPQSPEVVTRAAKS